MMLRSFLPIGSLTTRFARVSLSTQVLPANLEVADAKVFDDLPEPLLKEENYYFPLISVPTSIPVHKFNEPGQLDESVPLFKKIFEVAIRKDIILDCVRYTRNKIRQPHKTKNMSEISGSNKKPYPQKGQGYSQVGHKRNSSWRGGMKAHGPRLRDFSIGVNRKVRALGAMMSYAAKYREGNLMIVDNFNVKSHKTKDLQTLLVAHGLDKSKCLFIDDEIPENFDKASGNLFTSQTLKRSNLNVYEIVKKDKVVITKDCFMNVQESLMHQYTYNGRAQFFQRSKAAIELSERNAATNGYAEAKARGEFDYV